MASALALLAPSEVRADPAGPCRPPPLTYTLRNKTPTDIRAARPPAARWVPPERRAGAADKPECFDAKVLESRLETALDSGAVGTVLCYQKELLRNRDEAGTTVVQFQLKPGSTSPRLENLKLVKNTVAVPVAQCLLEQVGRTTFSFDPMTQLTVIWTFVFSPIN
jgi:hypothetical protein